MEKQINKNHNNQSKEEEEESAHNVGSSIFTATEGEEGGHMINFADQFKDKVLAIHEHFDKNKDGFLNFDELSALQLCTSGQVLDSTMYGYICQGLGCAPSEGLHLDGLKLTYASDGANVGKFSSVVSSIEYRYRYWAFFVCRKKRMNVPSFLLFIIYSFIHSYLAFLSR